jgi:hypothetical protein
MCVIAIYGSQGERELAVWVGHIKKVFMTVSSKRATKSRRIFNSFHTSQHGDNRQAIDIANWLRHYRIGEVLGQGR